VIKGERVSELEYFKGAQKQKGKGIAVNGTPSHIYRVSLNCHMGSHSVTCHLTQVNTPRLKPSLIGWYSIYLPQTDGTHICSLFKFKPKATL